MSQVASGQITPHLLWPDLYIDRPVFKVEFTYNGDSFVYAFWWLSYEALIDAIHTRACECFKLSSISPELADVEVILHGYGSWVLIAYDQYEFKFEPVDYELNED